jgi:hypothetical protein
MRAKAKRAGPDGALIVENVLGGIAQRNGIAVFGLPFFRSLRLRRIRQRNSCNLRRRLQAWARSGLSASRSAEGEHQG